VHIKGERFDEVGSSGVDSTLTVYRFLLVRPRMVKI